MTMDANINKELPSKLKLPTVKMTRGVIRKTLFDENGMTYEVEEVIELPKIGREEVKEDGVVQKEPK